MDNDASFRSIYGSVMKNRDLFGNAKGSCGGSVKNLNFEPKSKIQKQVCSMKYVVASPPSSLGSLQLAMREEAHQLPPNSPISPNSSDSEDSTLSGHSLFTVSSAPVTPATPAVRNKRRSIFTPASASAGFKRKYPNDINNPNLDSPIDDNDQKARVNKLLNIIEAEKPQASKEARLHRFQGDKPSNNTDDDDRAAKLKELAANIDAKLNKSFCFFVFTVLAALVGHSMKQTILLLATLKATIERVIANLWRSFNTPGSDFAKNVVNLPILLVAVVVYIGIWGLYLVAYAFLMEVPDAAWKMVGDGTINEQN
jgi:hypothetical protein